MSNPPIANSPRSVPLRSALRDDSDKTPPLSGLPKAVQIAEPDASSIQELPPVEEVPIRQFPANVASRRLSGRAPPSTLSSRTSLISQSALDSGVSHTSSPAQLPTDDPKLPSQSPSLRPHHGGHPHRRRSVDQGSARLMAQIAEWIEHEKAKKQKRLTRGHRSHVKKSKSKSPPAADGRKAKEKPKPAKGGPSKEHYVDEEAVDDENDDDDDDEQQEPPRSSADAAKKRPRTPSTGSNSSEVSLDRLQRIVDDNLAAMGIESIAGFFNVPRHAGSASSASGRRQSRSLRAHPPSRAVSSDTDYVDGDVLVPSCDAVLDNSKTLKYAVASQPGLLSRAPSEVGSLSGRREEKERQAWLHFKNEIIRLAHTLRLKGWRRVPLEAGETISVERLSGALTNAVYVVSPPADGPPPHASATDPLAPTHAGAATAYLPRRSSDTGLSATGVRRSKPSKLLLRIYGPQVEHLIDRQKELSVLRRLARKKIGPRLLGTFANGRFEQYFISTTLTAASMREPETSRMIAKRMRELHDGVQLLEEELDEGPNVWKNWDKWIDTVERTITYLDREVLATEKQIAAAGGAEPSTSPGPSDAWKYRGLVCGVEWPKFRAMAEKYREHVLRHYGGWENIRNQLVFAHNDTQYGNILRMRPDERSPLLQPENEHKQLVVIDFEYAAANLPGLEFANHFTEWTYNYHDAQAPHACNAHRYPTPEQQRRFIRAYVEHLPAFPHQGGPNTPRFGPQSTAVLGLSSSTAAAPSPATPSASASAVDAQQQQQQQQRSTPHLHSTASTSSIADFMLDARVPTGGWIEEERKREELIERQVQDLMDETRLWRLTNSAMWVAWGIVQAKVPGLEEEEAKKTTTTAAAATTTTTAADGDNDNEDNDDAGGDAEEEFDYLAYAQDRALFFLGDCVQAGLIKLEELPEAVQAKIKMVEY